MVWTAARSAMARRLFAGGPEARLALLKACWPVAVGRGLEERTAVVALERETLRVRVPDGRWRKALHRMQPKILARLRQIAGDLAPRRLGYVEAAAAAPSPPAAREETATAAPRAACPAALAEAAAAIPDPELRARFVESASRYLAMHGGTRCAKP